MLHAESLACARGERVVLRDISLTLTPGKLLGVLGANGAGKTSLLATLAGEIPAHGGSLQLDGRALHAYSTAELARRRAVLPQSPSLSFDLGVREVVAMGAYPFGNLPASRLETLIARVLALADATVLSTRRYLALSGGEQQRVQFARVLLQTLAARAEDEYRVLMLDEPTASLDPRHQVQLLQGVARIAREEGVASLLVLHDVNLAAQWCDRLMLLTRGACVAQGTPREVLTPENLETVYGLPAQVIPHPAQADTPLVLFASRVEA
ncbi:MAG: heme ABC transporter ATP-binding protein [Candidatus Dactylopiibacterium carminicum]|uniref:Heme ABC transporter ATP-binding protein n=1 Tax=Candidatus Dactylopiibacterium carminicum TaxID=857335 RepID=A0A272ESG0_9RHOO|nr:heme ABC transporter ATP-binding protein [Candidatus Dactylopiibacterium carminicum]KAF7599020.1 heme ABC transporter ATP-binding protein [Candidatus Dactylopiibacterium carminicum]PAS93025.1 MAG: heme ABC transporter ATP-binding protein [Candidatus Dactylopiibacterium carminicum]PAS96699.1 MAG: heme ABC transporter ATP-binding protein [Candidatus Dactylopiibacterium carminicum]PAS99035.1 MAG: hemin ABC transporter ATP-binding protein [Candidatus Dactylopiibacterium carminicum]